jgi:Putative 2OG-Fe(II) oxygenase
MMDLIPCGLASITLIGELEADHSISGRTVFDDRSGVPKEIIRNTNLYEREISILPRAGMIVMFPARLYHYVEPYSGEGVRIPIAFNLWHSGFAVPLYEGMRDGSWWWVNFRGLMLVGSKIPEKLMDLP